MRRTLMQRDQELLEFEFDPATGDARVIDASPAGVDLLALAGRAESDANEALCKLLRKRCISSLRRDFPRILASYNARMGIELSLMGHGLSLSDSFWYRAPGSADRWADINFFDNAWDPGFGNAILSEDYDSLAACSPDVPDVTTSGRIVKAWERNEEGVFLVKAAEHSGGADIQGVKLASDLCAALFEEERFVPASIVERHGRVCSASPLMLASNEELINGNQLHAIAGVPEGPLVYGRMAPGQWSDRIQAYAAVGIADASAHVAKMACCSCLALLSDFHPGNFGVIRNLETGEMRAAPFFDYDGAFGFPHDARSLSSLCEEPIFAMLMCANRFSYLDPSWDWSWYDPQLLEGFEDHIMESYAPYHDLPPNFSELIADLFDMQRSYVTKVASARKEA